MDHIELAQKLAAENNKAAATDALYGDITKMAVDALRDLAVARKNIADIEKRLHEYCESGILNAPEAEYLLYGHCE